jgi:hypothetical protein
MSLNEAIAIELTKHERAILRCGITEWGGPAHCGESMARAIGFTSVAALFDESERLVKAIDSELPLVRHDWARVLLSTEVVFASDVVGSGVDWSTTTGFSDEETIRSLRSIQRKLSRRLGNLSSS